MSAANVVIYHEEGRQPLGFRNPLNAWNYATSTLSLNGGRLLAESSAGHFVISTLTTFDDFNDWYNNGR